MLRHIQTYKANIVRFAKQGSDCTINDLRSYNIEVVPETVVGNANLSPPKISPAILLLKKVFYSRIANR